MTQHKHIHYLNITEFTRYCSEWTWNNYKLIPTRLTNTFPWLSFLYNFFFLYRDCTHRIIFCQLNILEHKEKKNVHEVQKLPWLFQGWRKDGVFCNRGNPVYHIKCVHKKREQANKCQNTNIFPLDLTFIIPIYMIHIHTEKVSAGGAGGGSLWNKFSRTGSFHFLCLYRHFSKHKYSNTIKAQTIQSQQLQ